MKLFSLFCLLFFINELVLGLIDASPGPTEYFDQILIIDEPAYCIFYWSRNVSHILIEIHVKTYGWIELLMTNSNESFLQTYKIVVWTNDDGTGHFSERTHPQSWWPLYLNRQNDFTVVKFFKSLVTCEVLQTPILDKINFSISWGNSFFNDDYHKTAYSTITNGIILFETNNKVYNSTPV